MAIDRKKIIEEMSKVKVIGNEEGLIHPFTHLLVGYAERR